MQVSIAPAIGEVVPREDCSWHATRGKSMMIKEQNPATSMDRHLIAPQGQSWAGLQEDSGGGPVIRGGDRSTHVTILKTFQGNKMWRRTGILIS